MRRARCRSLFGIAALITACSAPGLVAAAELSAAEAREVVAEFVESTNSYHANFIQTLVSADGTTADREAGELWLQRPGRFRWEYREPWERQIVADGEQVWMYDSELDQVTVQPSTEALQQSPAALLVGDLSALDDYAYSAAEEGGAIAVQIEPVSVRGDFAAIVLRFAGPLLVQLELEDRFGQRTVVALADIEANPGLAPGLFKFTVPEGADVINQSAD